MAVKFGKRQLQHPTPKKVGNGLDIASAVLGVLVGYVGTAPYIPSNVTIILSSIFGLLVALCQVLKPFLGVKTNQRTVDIENVSEMDEPEKINLKNFPDTSAVPKQEAKP